MTSSSCQTIENVKVSEPDKLLSILLSYVKECQKKYGGKTELATEFDNCVAGLCSSLEKVLSHGLRQKPQENNQNFTLKQMTDIVSNSLNLNSESPSFWPVISYHLTKHEKERYSVLRHIWTDTGRGRAWIRSSLNERSLERYLHSLFSNEELLHRYYEDWALVCDIDKNSMLPNMAAGLGSILFAISIDKPELNNGEISSQRLTNVNEPIINISESSAIEVKRKHVAHIISFDDEIENETLSVGIPSSSTSVDSMECKGSVESCPGTLENTSKDQKSLNEIPILENPNQKVQDRNITLTPIQSEIGDLKIVDQELDDTIEISMDIAAVLSKVENQSQEYEMKIASLNKENENLRNQLKNYISAVQMLNVDSKVAYETLAKLALTEEKSETNYLIEAKFYEHKLVQVAEMHAELMEFNEYLQKLLNQKDAALQKLRKELFEAKGTTSYDFSLESNSYEALGTTNICIPSAFLTGTGSDLHHVYQIFIRAGQDEWNIYRRYSQFYALHKELKKIDPAIANFDFPPKKHIGNKDANLVEDRRKRLQNYLRKIFCHWPELSNCNSRFLLEQTLSFFRENFNQSQPNLNKRTSKYSTTENHYTGL